MKLEEYFKDISGRGVLSTADSSGNVNSALYSRPHFMEDSQVAFIMRERLTHNNLLETTSAVYLFEEEGKGANGVRLYLEKTGEEQDTPRIEELHRRKRSYEEDEELGSKYLVFFKVTKILPLLGGGDPGLSM